MMWAKGPVAVKLDNEIITYSADITIGSNNQNLALLLTLALLTCGFQIQMPFVFQNGLVTEDFCKNNGSYSPAASSTSKI